MTDDDVSGLFATGTAPDHDPDFAQRVVVEIGRARRLARFAALVRRAFTVLMLCASTAVAAAVIRPALVQLSQGAPQFMGVPAPMVVVVLIGLLALSARRLAFRSEADVGLVEPIE